MYIHVYRENVASNPKFEHNYYCTRQRRSDDDKSLLLCHLQRSDARLLGDCVQQQPSSPWGAIARAGRLIDNGGFPPECRVVCLETMMSFAQNYRIWPCIRTRQHINTVFATASQLNFLAVKSSPSIISRSVVFFLCLYVLRKILCFVKLNTT